MDETRTRFCAAIPASRSASSNDVNPAPVLSHTFGEENAFRNHVLTQFARLPGGDRTVSEVSKITTLTNDENSSNFTDGPIQNRTAQEVRATPALGAPVSSLTAISMKARGRATQCFVFPKNEGQSRSHDQNIRDFQGRQCLGLHVLGDVFDRGMKRMPTSATTNRSGEFARVEFHGNDRLETALVEQCFQGVACASQFRQEQGVFRRRLARLTSARPAKGCLTGVITTSSSLWIGTTVYRLSLMGMDTTPKSHEFSMSASRIFWCSDRFTLTATLGY